MALSEKGHCIVHTAQGTISNLFGVEHDGKQYEKTSVCVCMTGSLCCIAENDNNTVNQLHSNSKEGRKKGRKEGRKRKRKKNANVQRES